MSKMILLKKLFTGKMELQLDTKSKVFYSVLFILIIVSVLMTFYKMIILKDYQIISETSCDPVAEKCFVLTCDPSLDDTCPQDPNEQTTYYKNISKKASSIFLCENTAEKIGCGEELSCITDEQSCFYTYCDPNNLEEGEECSE